MSDFLVRIARHFQYKSYRYAYSKTSNICFPESDGLLVKAMESSKVPVHSLVPLVLSLPIGDAEK